MIQVSNVTLRFGKNTLFEDVNIKFTPGNCYGLIGAIGAGKSTFLKLLSGEIETSHGEITISKDERIALLKEDIQDTVARLKTVAAKAEETLDPAVVESVNKECDCIREEAPAEDKPYTDGIDEELFINPNKVDTEPEGFDVVNSISDEINQSMESLSSMIELKAKLENSKRLGKITNITTYDLRKVRSIVKSNGYSVENLSLPFISTELGIVKSAELDLALDSLKKVISKMQKKI